MGKISKKYKYVEQLKRRPATNKEIKEYIKLQEKIKSIHTVDNKTVLYLKEEEVPYKPKKKVKAKKYFNQVKVAR